MKRTMKKVLMVNFVYIASAISIAFTSATPTKAINTNFTGVWAINIDQSHFGPAPQYAAVRQWTFIQTDKVLDMKWIVVDAEGTTSAKAEKINLGGKVNISISQPGNITRKTTGIFSNDGKLLTTTTEYSQPNNPDMVRYTIIREFQLQDGGKKLNLKMATPGYTLDLFYDKKD